MLFVPGHSLSASSWDKAVEMGRKGGNGAFAAVFSGGDFRFHLSRKDGKVLSDSEAASTRMYIVDFADVFAATNDKAKQIAAAVRAIARARRSESLTMNVVTHSAGDADFDTAAASGSLDGVLNVRVRVAIGPVFSGTYVGSIGGPLLGLGGGLGRRLGEQAASELAEGSETIRSLQRAQIAMKQGFYRNTKRYDIQTNGLVGLTPRLDAKSIGNGDGFVQDSQRRPFVSRTFVIDALDPTALNHLKQPSYRGVLERLNLLLLE